MSWEQLVVGLWVAVMGGLQIFGVFLSPGEGGPPQQWKKPVLIAFLVVVWFAVVTCLHRGGFW